MGGLVDGLQVEEPTRSHGMLLCRVSVGWSPWRVVRMGSEWAGVGGWWGKRFLVFGMCDVS